MTLSHMTKLLMASVLWMVGITLTIAICAVAGLFWRLSQGPIDMQALLPSVESALVREESDLRFTIESASLQWQSIEKPFLLKAKNLSVRSQKAPFFFAPSLDIDISLRRLLLGQVRVQTVEMSDISLSLTRSQLGTINISGARQRDIYGPQRRSTSRDTTLSGIMTALPRIDALSIKNARIVYNDLHQKQVHVYDGADITIRQSGAHSNPDISGVVRLPYDANNAIFIISDFAYNAAAIRLDVMTSFNQINPATLKNDFLNFGQEWPILDIALSGQIGLALKDDFSLQSLRMRLNGKDGKIAWPDAWGDGVMPLNAIEISGVMDKETGLIDIEKLNATILENTAIKANGKVSLGADQTLNNLSATWDIANITQNAIARFWPQHIEDTLIEKWMVTRLKSGAYKTITGQVGLRRDDTGTLPFPQDLTVNFDFTGMDIDYANPLIPASAVDGSGVMKGKALTLDVRRGTIKSIDVTSGSLAFDDLITTGKGMADITLNMNGQVPDVFDYLSREPIAATGSMGFDAKKTKGRADMQVRVRFPTVRDVLIKDIRVDATATLRDVLIPNIVRGMELTGGPFALNATTQSYSLEGSGQLQDTPITLHWEEYFSPPADLSYTSRIKAQLRADKSLRTLFGADPYNWIAGPAAIDLTYSEGKNGQDRLDITADMTETRITIPELNLDKPLGQSSSLSLNGIVKGKDMQEINNLTLISDAATIKQGQVTFYPNGAIKTANLPSLKTGKTDAAITAKRSNANADSPLVIQVKGAQFDARPFLSSGKESDSETTADATIDDYRIELDVAEMATHKSYGLKNVIAYLHTNSRGHTTRLDLDSKVGNGPFKVRYDPQQEGPYSLKIDAADAGAMLQAMGLYNSMVKGRMVVLGRPSDLDNIQDVQGRASIYDFSVSEAPALAKLISALTISGLFDMLGNANNLSFNRLETDFIWKNNADGGLYQFTNGAVKSTALGLTFSGQIDQKTKKIDIKGTAVPASGLNKFIGKIPLIGDILTGGEGGGLIAATYKLSGPAAEPVVSVNPLSVLTPGILRRILFENGTSTTPDNDTTPAPQKQQRSPLN